MKICKNCKLEKDLKEFSVHAACIQGVRPECKTCYNIKAKSDIIKYVKKIYNTQKVSSIKRNHPPPDYSLDELTEWVKSQDSLENIWSRYQESNHTRRLAPSLDRLDCNLPYTLGNLELVTWEENDRRGSEHTKSGVKLTQHKAINAFYLDGSFYKSFVSLHEAAREVGGTPTNIQRVADEQVITKPDGRTTMPKTSKGFIWKWKEVK